MSGLGLVKQLAWNEGVQRPLQIFLSSVVWSVFVSYPNFAAAGLALLAVVVTVPQVSAAEGIAPLAAPNAAPQVALPYKLITTPVPDAAAAQPAMAAHEATPVEPKAQVLAPMAPPVAATTAAAPPAPAKPQTTLAIDIDLNRQRMTLVENGRQVGSWPISSGREGFRSPTGTFRPLWASKMWFSKKYDNAPMPHAVFFSGGVAMHATQATGQLGHPASHGCIRQSPANAATTYALVAKHGHEHTKIVVHGTPHDDEPRVARHDRTPGTRFASSTQRLERQTAMRRVILVDHNGNRRMAEIPANDPRLATYQSRVSSAASHGSFFGAAW